MSDHRAPGRRKAPRGSVTPQTPVAGKRRAEGRQRMRRPKLTFLPSAPVVAGVSVLAIAAGGAVTVSDNTLSTASAAAGQPRQLNPVGALSGTGAVSSTSLLNGTDRGEVVSRDSDRQALESSTEAKMKDAAEAMSKQRNAALSQFAEQAEQQAKEIAKNQWVLPVAAYRLTNTFGLARSYYSSGYHTGLDFAAPSGTPIMAVANGVITSTGYEGAYGNQTVQTLEDGMEIWYNHQTSFAVSPGDVVRAGQVIGYVGSTGNSTGPHLHLEIRPGAGDPVDPYSALMQHGLMP